MVFCCCSPSASGFDVLCVQRWYSAYLGCSGVHRPLKGQGAKKRYEGTIADRGNGGFTIHDFITILCHVIFLFCKLFEHYGQTHFPIIKTNLFKVTKYKKIWQIFRPKWEKIKIFISLFSHYLSTQLPLTGYLLLF